MALDFEHAAALMAQLGNATRLRIVRLLVEAGPDGLPVGEMQRELGVPGSTLSHHVAQLRNARLVTQTRHGTTLNCVVDFSRIDAIVRFLTDQCCARRSRSAVAKRGAA